MQVNQFRILDKLEKRFDTNYHIFLDLQCRPTNMQNGAGSDDYIVGFYTGLNDKDGVPIYSGDYIDFVVKAAAHGRESEQYTAQEVYFDPECAAFMIGKNYSKSGDFWWGHSFLDEIDRTSLKVTGNIFQGK